ncbi:MAG: hypothetical protein L0K86_17095, partial [Actinomycetia bacterium]|nr:hypothetical protein [Actinomycetes bacterium]
MSKPEDRPGSRARVRILPVGKSALAQLAVLAERDGPALDPVEAESALVERLSKVPDMRRRRGRRHPLVVVLALAAC